METSEIYPCKPSRVCEHPGCRSITRGRFCDKHRSRRIEKETEYRERCTPGQLEARKVRGGRRWSLTRSAFLSEHPFCDDPLGVHPVPVLAEEVHHKTKVETDPNLCFDWGNLQSLCKACHRAIEE